MLEIVQVLLSVDESTAIKMNGKSLRKLMLIALLVAGLIVDCRVSSLDSNSFNRLGKRQSSGIDQSITNQRPTQFLGEPPQSAHSRGSLILPANNHHYRASNQHSLLHLPTKIQQTSNNNYNNNNNNNHGLDLISLHSHPAPDYQRFVTSDHNSSGQVRGQQPESDLSARAIELALRQSHGDESVFHPTSIIDATDHHSFDWSSQPSSAPAQSVQPQESSPPKDQQQTGGGNHHNQTPITTEPNNNIAQPDLVLPHESNLDDRAINLPSTVVSSPSDRQTETTAGLHNGSMKAHRQQQQDGNQQLSNQVVYEGPATVPPVEPDYYFSEKQAPAGVERVSNVWWALGFGHELERAGNLTRDDYLEYCAKSELLISNKQRSLCRQHPRIMPVVVRGLKLAIDECQTRFSSSRWNCSFVLQNSLNESATGNSKVQVFGEVMKQRKFRHSDQNASKDDHDSNQIPPGAANRERSFLNAIIAAGLAHAMTKACSQGELPEECSCDKKIRSKNNRGKIEWVVCSDDIDFGAKFSRDWTDNNDGDSDTTTMINTHNYEVGRRVFKSATDITCTCQNGENGLCQTKRCWKHLGPFSDIGDELMRRYEGATHVQLSNRDPHKLRPVKRGVRKPKRKDLVYIDESPDYCTQDSRLGVLGTQNRHCNSTSLGPDSCSILCCGRGYQTILDETEEDCNCKFVWCCQVKCDRCKRQIANEVCN